MAKRKVKYQVILEKEDEDKPWGDEDHNVYPNTAFIRINGGPRKLCRKINGARCKYIGRNIVVKLEDSLGQTSTEIDRYLNTISARDMKYFPKLLGYDEVHCDFLIQERIMLKKPSTRMGGQVNKVKHKKAFQIVKRLCHKYGLLRDITPEYPRNWGLRKDGTPVIYDFGL